MTTNATGLARGIALSIVADLTLSSFTAAPSDWARNSDGKMERQWPFCSASTVYLWKPYVLYRRSLLY